MSEPAEVEARLLHLLNVIAVYSGFARQDGALATADEALALCHESGLVEWEFAFVLQLCRLFDSPLFPDEYERNVSRLIDLAIDQVDRMGKVEEYSYIGPMLDGFLERLPDPPKDELIRRFAAVRDRYHQCQIDDLVFEFPVAAQWPPEACDMYRLLAVSALAEPVPDEYRSIDLEAVHARLCEAIEHQPLSAGNRRAALADVHHLTVIAAVRAGDLRAALSGAKKLLTEPSQIEHHGDRVAAAHTVLWVMSHALADQPDLNVPRVYRSRTIQAVGRITWETLTSVYEHQVARFAVANLIGMYPLVGAYVDFLAQRPATRRQAIELIALYQGAAVSIAARMATDPEQHPEGFDFFIHELDRLLRYHSLDGGADGPQDEPMIVRKRGSRASPPAADDDGGYAGLTFHMTDLAEKIQLPAKIEAVWRTVPVREAIVAVFLTEQWAYAITIHSGARPRLRRLCTRRDLLAAARPFASALRHGDERLSLAGPDFAWLYELVCGPMSQDLPAGTERLVLVAPQLQVPLHLAYDVCRGRYLIEDYSIAYAHSIDAHRRLDRRPTARGGTALLLDGSAGAGDGQALRNVATEMAAISATLRPAFRIDGPHRRTDDLAPAAGPVAIAHYGGHMEADETGARWRLWLEDGFITPGKLMARVGDGTEIVSLFSCFSADRRGDGPEPVGISTILAAAGARNFVGCLWAIPDITAAKMASQLYAAWAARSVGLPDVLRAVMIARRSQPPGLWGSLVCYGPHSSGG